MRTIIVLARHDRGLLLAGAIGAVAGATLLATEVAGGFVLYRIGSFGVSKLFG